MLVVDDTETNREIAVKLLSLEGAICESAENGREAIERLRADPGDFDLVLMDVQMPDMDGLEATRVIRHDLGLADLPVIALTAGAMASQRELALAAGMNGFVAKPFRLRELVAALTPWIGARLFRSRNDRRLSFAGVDAAYEHPALYGAMFTMPTGLRFAEADTKPI